jgi:hypothetical protein
MYRPPEVGQDLEPEEFNLLILEQFREIAQAFAATRPAVYTSVPVKPYNGLIVIADGTDWNPGSGAGYYGYYNAAWTFLG